MTIDDVVEVAPGPSTPGRRRRLVGIGTVVAVLLAGGGVAAWAATRGGGAAAGGTDAATCPTTMPVQFASNPDRPVVPAKPTASGIDGRLVPERAPQSVLLCEFFDGGLVVSRIDPAVSPFPGGDVSASAVPVPEDLPTTVATAESLQRHGAFDGSDGVIGPLVAALQHAPVRPLGAIVDCAAPTEPMPEFLVGLTYGDGLVWVAVGYCTGAFNGLVTGAVDVLALVGAALDVAPDTPVSSSPEPATSSPAYSAPPQPLPGSTGASGGSSGDPGTGIATGGGVNPDPGDDPLAACVADTPANAASADRFVPFAPTAVRICHLAVDPSGTSAAPVDQSATVASDLVAELGTLPLLPPDGACPAIGGEVWALLSAGAGGAQELVTVDAGGCGTASNGLRTATADDALYAALRTLD